MQSVDGKLALAFAAGSVVWGLWACTAAQRQRVPIVSCESYSSMLTSAAALNQQHKLTTEEEQVIDRSIPVVAPECKGPQKDALSLQAQAEISAVAAVLANHGGL